MRAKAAKLPRGYWKRNFWLYLFLVPGLIFFLVFCYAPMYGVSIAFQEYSPVLSFSGSPWVGWKNFEYLFTSENFLKVFSNSLIISLLRLAWGFPAPILLAVLINEVKLQRFKKASQTILYLPHFISWVVLSGMIINLLSPSSGALNYLIELFGGEKHAFLQDPSCFRTILVASDIWKEAGWGTIVYLAAISGIDSEMYAGMFQKIIYVTIPNLTPTIVVLFILRLGSILRNGLEQIFMLYSPVVYDVADVFETYTYRVAMVEGRFSFATAVGLFQSVVGLILVFGTNKISQRIGGNGLW